MRRRRITGGAVILVLTAMLAGCGSSNGGGEQEGPGLDEVLAAVDGVPSARRLAALEKLAKEEGSSLSVYTSLSGSVVEGIIGAFEDAYDIDVSLYRASSETVEQRLLEEADAGFHGADVVDTAGQTLILVGGRGLLADYPFDPAPLIEDTVHEGWAATRLQQFVLAWNTKTGERPPSWQALGDPKWHGRLLIEAGDWDWYARLWEYWVDEEGVAPEEADARFERILRNATVVKGHSLGAQLLAAGERDVFAAAYAHHIDNLVEDGAPVAWTPAVEPVILRQNGVAVMKDARHPAAAALFAEWALGPGQAAYGASGYRSPRRDADVPAGEFRSVDEDRLAAERDRWVPAWERLVTLGTPGPTG